MPLPRLYQTAGEAAIASYDFTDIAEGTGVTKFYLFSSKISGATAYHLGNNVLYSADITRTAAGADTDDNFDLTVFNLPRTIKGTGTIQLPYGLTCGGGGGCNGYAICKLWKVPAVGSATEIISACTPNVTIGAAAAEVGVWNIPITISQTHFKKGDILRLQVLGYTSNTESSHLGIDPKNRAQSTLNAGTMVATDGNILIPFKLDL